MSSSSGVRAWLRAIGPAGAVSLLSLAAAWAAIALAVHGSRRFSVLLALLAFLLDMLDGYVARRTGRASEFGRLLDSMIDLVNYSLYSAVLVAFHLAPGWLGWALGFVIVATGALRLVRFSVTGFEDEQTKYYRGVVTPHLSLATMILLFAAQWAALPGWVVAVVLLVLSLLQLSDIKVPKTGWQWFWAGLVIPLGVAAVLWLS